MSPLLSRDNDRFFESPFIFGFESSTQIWRCAPPYKKQLCPCKHSKTTRIDSEDFALKWIWGKEILVYPVRARAPQKTTGGARSYKKYSKIFQYLPEKIKNILKCNSAAVRGNLASKSHTKYIYI